MQTVTISLWLRRAGFLRLWLALFVLMAHDKLTPPIEPGALGGVGAAAVDVFLVLPGFWISLTLGALLLLSPFLLRLHWWYSWIAFIGVGLFFVDGCTRSRRLTGGPVSL
jgi:hypothetical protein